MLKIKIMSTRKEWRIWAIITMSIWDRIGYSSLTSLVFHGSWFGLGCSSERVKDWTRVNERHWHAADDWTRDPRKLEFKWIQIDTGKRITSSCGRRLRGRCNRNSSFISMQTILMAGQYVRNCRSEISNGWIHLKNSATSHSSSRWISSILRNFIIRKTIFLWHLREWWWIK